MTLRHMLVSSMCRNAIAQAWAGSTVTYAVPCPGTAYATLPPAMGLVSPLAEAPLWDGGTVKMAVPSPGTANYTLPPAMGLVRPTLGATRALCGGTQTQRHTRRIAGAGTSHPTGVGRPYRGPATPPIPPYPTIPPAPTPHV